jgi:integral membrane sensor domain MASE1
MSLEASGIGDLDRAAIGVPSTPAISSIQTAVAPIDVISKNTAALPYSGPVHIPFAGLTGCCFLRGCLWIELLASWIREKQTLPRVESASCGKYDWHVIGWLRSSLGAASCTAVAGCLIPVFSGSAHRSIVPFLFLLVILYVALRFGHIAGMIGTIGAALVFEIFLFEPTLSLAISSPAARNHLISMVILGVCASEFLGRRKAPVVYKPW